jgi:FAD:protein FMN transferase
MRFHTAAGLLWVGLLTALVIETIASAGEAAEPELHRYRYSQIQMGVPVEMLLYAADERTANLAADAAYARFRELNSLLSDYDPQSELSRLSDTAGQGRAVPVGEDLWFVLQRAQDLSARSEGAFDVTVGPYVKLWRRARRTKEFPAAARMDEARRSVGYQYLKLDPAAHTARLERPGMRLDLGGIAMGYADDEALKVLKQHGVPRALIDGSGDILAGDPPPGASGWKIGIAPLMGKDGPPSRYLLLANAAVTTSGDMFQHLDIGGKRYSHVLDPRTGLGLTTRSSVTVIAPDCIAADSLTKAVSVLGPERGLEIVEATPGAAAFIACPEGDEMKTYQSRRFNEYDKTAAVRAGSQP